MAASEPTTVFSPQSDADLDDARLDPAYPGAVDDFEDYVHDEGSDEICDPASQCLQCGSWLERSMLGALIGPYCDGYDLPEWPRTHWETFWWRVNDYRVQLAWWIRHPWQAWSHRDDEPPF